MNEYEVTISNGLFSTKKFYLKADSAEEIYNRIMKEFEYEIESEELSIQGIKKL